MDVDVDIAPAQASENEDEADVGRAPDHAGVLDLEAEGVIEAGVGKLLVQPQPILEGDESDESDEEDGYVLPRFRERVEAPLRDACKNNTKTLSPSEQRALFDLLGSPVRRKCLVVKSGVSVNGQARGAADS